MKYYEFRNSTRVFIPLIATGDDMICYTKHAIWSVRGHITIKPAEAFNDENFITHKYDTDINDLRNAIIATIEEGISK